MIALIGLFIGMSLGILVRELWARRSYLQGLARTVAMAVVLIVVFAPVVWFMVELFLRLPKG